MSKKTRIVLSVAAFAVVAMSVPAMADVLSEKCMCGPVACSDAQLQTRAEKSADAANAANALANSRIPGYGPQAHYAKVEPADAVAICHEEKARATAAMNQAFKQARNQIKGYREDGASSL